MFHGVSHQLSRKKAAELLLDSGYKAPTGLQEAAFNSAFSGRDFAADYSPGEGKTLSFLIPAAMDQGTLIVTDKEQETGKIKTALRKLQPSISNRNISVFLSENENIQKEIHLLAKNPVIIVGTTTRIIDHIRRNNIELNNLKTLVIDITNPGKRDFFDKDVLFISTKLSRKVRRAVFLPDLKDLDSLEDILRRPVVSNRNTGSRVKNSQENREIMNEEQVKEKINQFIDTIKESEDPIVLKEYKKLIKKNVPFHLRGYFNAFLFKSLCGDTVTVHKKKPENMQTVFINIGKNRRVYPKDLFRLFQKSLDIPGEMIGSIKVLGNYSFVEIASDSAAVAVKKMDGMSFRGKKLTVNFAYKKDKKEPALTE